MTTPKIIVNKLESLNNLVSKHPDCIPAEEVAKFLHMDADILRTSIARGTCPFGVGGKRPGNERTCYKIPTVTFYLWYTNTKLNQIDTHCL